MCLDHVGARHNCLEKELFFSPEIKTKKRPRPTVMVNRGLAPKFSLEFLRLFSGILLLLKAIYLLNTSALVCQ